MSKKERHSRRGGVLLPDRVTLFCRVEPEIVAWLDELAKEEHISRNAVLGQLLRLMMATSKCQLQMSPLFKEMESQLEERVEEAFKEEMTRQKNKRVAAALLVKSMIPNRGPSK